MRIREAPPVRLVPWGLSRRNNTPTSSFVFFLLLRPPANAPSPRRVSAFAKKIFRTKDNKTTRRHLQEQGTKLFLRPVTRVAPLIFMPGDYGELKFNTNPPTPWHRLVPGKTETREVLSCRVFGMGVRFRFS